MNNYTRRRLTSIFVFILLTTFLLDPVKHFANPQQAADQAIVARVRVRNQQELLQFVSLGVDLLEMRKGDDLFILTTPAQVEELKARGYIIDVDDGQTAMLKEQRLNTFMGGYRTLTEIRAFLDGKAASFPNLAEVFVYGQSWDKVRTGGTSGYDLFGITLTNKLRPGPKPTFFLMAAIHARELTTSELALRFADYLLTNYGVDADATWLLDEHKIVIVPVVNPDGRAIAQQGFYQRKNTNRTYGGGCPDPPTASSQYGVDLNRNSHFKWGTVNPPSEPRCGQTYPGPAVTSEPETDAIENLTRTLFADQRGPLDTDPAPLTTTGLFLTLHSYSNLVLWPWGWTTTPAPNSADLALMGQKFASYNNFTPQQSTDLYPTSGTTDDWAYGELGVPAFTFEVGPSSGTCGGFFPPFSCLDGGTGGSFWSRNLPAFLYAARIARAPYQLVRGPTIESVTAASSTPGIIDLRAQLSEQNNGGQAIAAAEYYMDTPPWGGGAPVAMSPLDGNFNSTIEVASATVGPFGGRHLIYVRGRDANGNWGPVRAIFVNGVTCTDSIFPTAQSFGTGGGAGGITLSTPAGCSWSAASNDSWIVLTSETNGVGNTVVTFEVRENFAERFRTGTLIVGGQAFAVNQAGTASGDCNNSILPTSQSIQGGGGSGTVNILAEEGCVWSAASNDSWITITSNSGGIGSGSITYTVNKNLGTLSRKGTITVAGATFTVKQKGA